MRLGQIQYEQRRRRHIVHMEKLSPRCSGPPDYDLVAAFGCGLVEPADERRQNVAVLGVKIIARPVKVGGHHAAIIDAMLAVVALAQLYTRDLCDSVRLVRWLERTRKQRIFTHRLRRSFRVDA